MSQRGVEQLIGKALADKAFLDEFLKGPEAAIKKLGLDISSEELAQINKTDAAKARRFAENFSREFADRKAAGM